MKTVKYYKEIYGKTENEPYLRIEHDAEFSKKMELIAKAYAKWDNEHTKAMDKLERYGIEDFTAMDKAMDVLTRRYNSVHGTSFSSEEFSYSMELQKAYMTAVHHETI